VCGSRRRPEIELASGIQTLAASSDMMASLDGWLGETRDGLGAILSNGLKGELAGADNQLAHHFLLKGLQKG